MASVEEKMQDALNNFADFNEKLFGNSKNLASALSQFELAIKNSRIELDDLSETGELTAKAFDAMFEQIEKTRKKGFDRLTKDTMMKHMKVMKEVQDVSHGLVDAFSSSIRSITKFIPLVGDQFANMFEKKIAPKLSKRIQASLIGLFGKGIGKGGGFSWGKITALGAVLASIAGLVKIFSMTDKVAAGIVKQTGFLRKNVRNITNDMFSVWSETSRLGIELDEIQEVTSSLISEFGTISIITKDLIKQAALWQRVYGLAADEVAGLVDTMHRVMGMANDEMDGFVNNLDANARRAGISTNLIMKDIARNTNFFATYSDRAGKNIKEAAFHARAMGSELSASVAMADEFLNYESAIQNTMELNAILGSDLNAWELHSLARAGKIHELEKKVAMTVAERFEWSELDALQRKAIAKSMGQEVGHAAKLIKYARGGSKEYDQQLKSLRNIEEAAADMMDIWEQIKAIFLGALKPHIESIGKYMINNIQPVLKDFLNLASTKGWWEAMKDALGKIAKYMGEIWDEFVKPKILWMADIIADAIVAGIDKFIDRNPLMKQLFGKEDTEASDRKKLSQTNTAINIQDQTTSVFGESIGKFIGFLAAPVSSLDDLSNAAKNSAYLLEKRNELELKLGENKLGLDYSLFSNQVNNPNFSITNPQSLDSMKNVSPLIPRGATGGIVRKPTLAVIGEAGPEAVVPMNGNIQQKNGILQFARGGTITPMSNRAAMAAAAGAQTSVSNIRDANDPEERRMRENAVEEMGRAYRNELQKEERRVWKEQRDQLERFGDSVDRFGVGSNSFGTSVRQQLDTIMSDGFWRRVANSAGESLGLGPVGDMYVNAQKTIDAYRNEGVKGALRELTAEGGMLGAGGLFGNSSLAKFLGGESESGLAQSYLKEGGSGVAKHLSKSVGKSVGQNILDRGIKGMGEDASGFNKFISKKLIGDDGKLSGFGGAAMSLANGDLKGAGKSIAKGMAKKFLGDKAMGMAAKFVPGLGQLSMVNDVLGMFGIDGMGMAMDALKKIPGIGKIGGAIGKVFGFGKGATIESAWHPKILEQLYMSGGKPGDKIPKDEIKKLNMQLFGSDKAPGTKDGFSFYDMKGDEEKADRQRSPAESLKLSYQIASDPKMAGMAATFANAGSLAKSFVSLFDRPESGGGYGNNPGISDDITYMADGGIVKSAMHAVVGEAGPEIIAPISEVPDIINKSIDNTELIREIRELKRVMLEISKRPINVRMNTRRVSEAVAENFEEMSHQ